MNIKQGYAFIIDTNEYAGNFEREMTAFCTGVVGECEVGEEYVSSDITDIFEDNIQQAPDDHGCERPCEAVHHNGGYNSVAIFFYNKPTEDQIVMLKERAQLFNEERKVKDQWNPNSNIEILGFRLIQIEQSSTEIKL